MRRGNEGAMIVWDIGIHLKCKRGDRGLERKPCERLGFLTLRGGGWGVGAFRRGRGMVGHIKEKE